VNASVDPRALPIFAKEGLFQVILQDCSISISPALQIFSHLQDFRTILLF